MILITGGTGTTGREIISELQRLGATGVRALVRDAGRASFIREAGFETAEGDFDRPETLDAALAGVERALLLTPPSPKTFEFQRDFIEASKRAGVRRVVKFSAFGADADAPEGFGKWHGQAEDYLKQSGLAWTMLQPNFFMQNLLGQAQQIAAEGRIYQPVGDAKASFIDVRDIAAVAARALVEDGHEGKSYVLTGPEALSYADVAAKLSTVAGRQITYVPITPEQFRQGALAAGLPEWLVGALERLNEIFAAGYAAEVTDHVRAVGRKEPTTFDQFARDNAQAFKGGQVG
ncbi:MAG: SDR family oxidoreductase [Acidobacteriota bacterium]|nr:SDR family oxidoreductase [Acidobacteriota bacterium]MDQ5838701.1 SDR family oxidoreductase [Acidobacteriota bacterium]